MKTSKPLFYFVHLFFVHLLTASCVYANTGTVDCENAAAAKGYAATFSTLVKAETDKYKAREKERQQVFEAHQSRLIAAGIWKQPEDGKAFIANVLATTPELKALEEKRIKTTKEIQTLKLTILGLDFMSGGDKQAEQRGTCIFGQQLMAQLAVNDDVAENSWKWVNQQAEALLKEKSAK